MTEKDDLLTGTEVAALLGITPGTWRSLVHQRFAPPADDPDLDRPPSRRLPRWRRSTVLAFKASRPGRGRRAQRYG
jgi:hypothetical protein